MTRSYKAQKVLDRMKLKLSRQIVSSLAACGHCNNCAQACHYVLTNPEDPTYLPAYKGDLLRKIYKRHVDWTGRVIPWWVKAKSIAHTADLMLVLGRNRLTTKDDMETILGAISNKLVHSTNWIYIHGEDERLASAVMAILGRNLVSVDFVKDWFKSMTEPEKSWQGAYVDEGQANAYHKVRNFLRSIWMAIQSSDDLPQKAEIESAVFESLNNLKPY